MTKAHRGRRGADAVSPREQELLQLLEVIRRNRERITVTDFALRAGYKTKDKRTGKEKGNRLALQRYRTLRTRLAEYIGTQGREHLQAPSEHRALERALATRAEEVAALRREVAEEAARAEALAERAAAAEAARRTAERERDALRGMVTALVAQIAQRSVVRAAQLERDLLKTARALVPGLPDSALEAPTILALHREPDA